MKKLFIRQYHKGKTHGYFTGQNQEGQILTAGFFKFLLAFTVIIALSFGTLFFLGIITA